MGRLSTMVAERARKSLNRDLKTVDGKIVLDLAVIVPTLNESAVIASVLESIRDNLPSVRYTICVADGGSTDGTVEIVKKCLNQIQISFCFIKLKIDRVIREMLGHAWH